MYEIISPWHIANNLIKKSWNENDSITPVRLHILIYFLYATYLKATGEKLFNEPFEIGKYNIPMTRSIDFKFGSYGNNKIESMAKDSNGRIFKVRETGVLKKCLDTVWGKYKNCTDKELCILSRNKAFLKAEERKCKLLDDIDIVEEGTEIVCEKFQKKLVSKK